MTSVTSASSTNARPSCSWWAVTAWAARLNVLATDMRVEQRSLEDVFLDLTGRELRS